MSWSLNIQGGDLDFVSKKSGAAVVTGKDKVFQDIRAALLEPMGTDPMHPDYGSLLDGGRLPGGQVVDSMIGKNATTVFRIEEEIGRMVRSIMDRQELRIASDIQNFGRSTLSGSETILGISSIQSKQVGTTLVVRVEVIMQDKNTISIVAPIT